MNKQTIFRIWHTFRLYTITSSGKRAEYLRKKKIFHSIGLGCTIMGRKVPLYSRLISLGNNVHLATGVLLITHDAIHMCLNNNKELKKEGFSFNERIGCIEIGDDVFVGANTTILYDVKIGSKVVIGAGSLVNKDIPDNSVAVGNPARVIGTFDELVKKREKNNSSDQLKLSDHNLSSDLESLCWADMKERREKQ